MDRYVSNGDLVTDVDFHIDQDIFGGYGDFDTGYKMSTSYIGKKRYG